MVKGNYSRMEVDGRKLRLVVGQPDTLYKAAHPYKDTLGPGPRWYCVMRNNDCIGHVIRWNVRNNDWRVDVFRDTDRWAPGRVEDQLFVSRRSAIEFIARRASE